jgi:hypothetical protein
LKIVVVGGYGNGQDLSSAEVVDPFSDVESSDIDPYPYTVVRSCMSGNLHCGGYKIIINNIIKHYKTCYQLINNKQWKAQPQMNYGRSDSSCTMLSNDSFWIVGGESDDSSETVKSSELFKMEEQQFHKSLILPENMVNHCMAQINKTHLFVAGSDYNEKMAYIVEMTPQTKFHKITDMNEDRYKGAACGSFTNPSSFKDGTEETFLIVAGGGYYGSTTTSIYSMANQTWTPGPDLPRGFFSCGYVSNENHPLILIGGLDEHNNKRNDIMAYDKELNTFEVLPGKLNVARYGFAASGIYID